MELGQTSQHRFVFLSKITAKLNILLVHFLVKAIVDRWAATVKAYLPHNQSLEDFRLRGYTSLTVDEENTAASGAEPSNGDLPKAPPASMQLLAEWDEEYDNAWRHRDRRAESNDIFSLEREAGML